MKRNKQEKAVVLLTKCMVKLPNNELEVIIKIANEIIQERSKR